MADRQFRWIAAELRQFEIRVAHALRRVEGSGAHQVAGCASVAEFAERCGMAAQEARRLLDLGRALDAYPGLEADVRAGLVPVASAAVLGEISMEPEVVQHGVDWVALARSETTRDFRRAFLRRRDEIRAGAPVEPVTLYVTSATREEFGRARDLASRRARCPLTLGEAISVVVSEWLREHDPLRRAEGTRRVPDLSSDPGSRYVPAEVDRAVRARSGDVCIVPFCGHALWLERSHRVAYARGGGQEAANLDLLCGVHHELYEEGHPGSQGRPMLRSSPIATGATSPSEVRTPASTRPHDRAGERGARQRMNGAPGSGWTVRWATVCSATRCSATRCASTVRGRPCGGPRCRT
jgi:hypothetical protein